MSTDELVKGFGIIWSLLAIVGGSMLFIRRDWFIKANERAFLSLYEKTKFTPFKHQAETMTKPYMRVLVTSLGIFFILLGVLILLGWIKI